MTSAVVIARGGFRPKRIRGFSLTELLVVTVITAIVLAMILVTSSRVMAILRSWS